MQSSAIVLVHGLWMNGMDMAVLNRRLRRAGFNTKQFRYTSRRTPPRVAAVDLNGFVNAIDSETVHFVCHSLGGIVVRHLFHSFPRQPPGNVVTMGTPHQASSSAQALMSCLPGRWLLGSSIDQGLLGDVPGWSAARPLGSIAGTLRFGFGLLLRGIAGPGDGTVTVAETRCPGMADHVTVRASHFGLLLSRAAAGQCLAFLQHGRFHHGPVSATA